MSWYDIFALSYDGSLEQLYRPHREAAVAALQLHRGARVLDLPCGTGQSFDLIIEGAVGQVGIGGEGTLVGLDLSRGMLRRARRRVERAGWSNVVLLERDARQLGAGEDEDGSPSSFDAILCALGLTAFPDWEAVFAAAWALLEPGGRFVIMDVHAAERRFQTKLVELMARADLSREVWQPLERLGEDFSRVETDASPKKMGGTLFIASARKPASGADG